MSVNHVSSFISTYTADVSGVASALFEMGGMTVIDDASGCNSTYNTHDEPRWYDFDSFVFISAISEIDMIMGDDEKLINDIVNTAQTLKPKFIAIAGTPIPMITGTDFRAVAKVIETRTKIPCFGFPTNGMHSYISGASMAFCSIAERFVSPRGEKRKRLSVISLGTTPLDFSVNGYCRDIEKYLAKNEIEVVSRFGIGGNLDEIKHAAEADINLVVSSCGYAAAKFLNKKYKIPYVLATPVKGYLESNLIEIIKKSADEKTNFCFKNNDTNADVFVIAEAITGLSLSEAVYQKYNVRPTVICPPDTDEYFEDLGCIIMKDEEHIKRLIKNASVVAADPLFKKICPQTSKFYEFPHEAFSGRIYRKNIYNLMKTDI